MNRLSRVLLLVVLAVATAASAEGPKSRGPRLTTPVGGWSKAHFGMTTSQVIAAFHGEVKKLDPPESYEEDKYLGRAEISDTRIGPIEHALVRFVFPAGRDRLERIYITESVVKPEAGIDVQMRGKYDDLSKMLIEKYGRPSTEAKDTSRDPALFKESMTWALPTMVVELSYQHMTLYGEELSCFLSISYRPPLSAAERDRL